MNDQDEEFTMNDQNEAGNKKKFSMEDTDLEAIAKAFHFTISLCDTAINTAQYEQLDDLSSAQKEQIDTMLKQTPIEDGKGCVLTFPAGLAATLTLMKNAGVNVNASAGYIMGAFTAMAAVTGQFFLVQINRQLKKINQNLDKIIGFLYGDKKAELLAEISFTKQACSNYRFIMTHDEQRIATISSLQQAMKVAIKDIEFYQYDLERAVSQDGKNRYGNDVPDDAKNALQLFECIDLSAQLYALSSSLEVYYSQNYDKEYIKNVQEESGRYIGMCKSSMLTAFSSLLTTVKATNAAKFKQKSKDEIVAEIQTIINSLHTSWESSVFGPLSATLDELAKEKKYYLTSGGDVYVK